MHGAGRVSVAAREHCAKGNKRFVTMSGEWVVVPSPRSPFMASRAEHEVEIPNL
jgi:hypothetical protein